MVISLYLAITLMIINRPGV